MVHYEKNPVFDSVYLHYKMYCVLFFQLSQVEGLQLLQVQQLPQLELQLEVSRTTVLPGLSTTDSRLPTMDREGRRLDRQLLHSRDNRWCNRACLV